MERQELMELLGMKVVDKVTEFKGVVTSISFDLYGCIQVLVSPGTDEQGKYRDSRWFDTQRLRVTSKKPVMERPNFEGEKGPVEKPIDYR